MTSFGQPAKAMYKLEPAVAPGGEVIIYAPHLRRGQPCPRALHLRGWLPHPALFLNDWERFKHVPLGVLAHSTHVRGSGRLENGVEKAECARHTGQQDHAADCARLNLGYLDPATVNMEAWQNREAEGILIVPRAGEVLYRLAQPRSEA